MPTRRRFIQSVAALSATPLCARPVLGASSTKISRIDLFPMRYPMTGYFKFFTGPHGSAGRAAVIVKMTCDDGTVGWGQSVPVAKWSYETLETATRVMKDYYAPLLIGRDPFDLEGAHAVMDASVAPAFTTGMPIARAGLDLAMHDCMGKIANKPLAELWGKKSGGKLTLSWTVNVRKLEDLEGVVAQGAERGYKNFNIKVAPDPDFDVKLARRLKKRVPDGFLWADANGGYDPDTALRAAPRLAEVGVDVLEAPMKPNQIGAYQKLTQQNALPIYMDEGLISPVEVEEFARLKMMHGVAMKPGRCGGLWSNKRQIEVCEKYGLGWLGSGLCDPDISLAATMILYGACGLKKPAALNGPQYITEQVLTQPLKIENGFADVPTGPGLGIEVDEEKVVALMKQSGGDKLL